MNLVIECDGDYWHAFEKAKERDRKKQYSQKRFSRLSCKTLQQTLDLKNKIYYLSKTN